MAARRILIAIGLVGALLQAGAGPLPIELANSPWPMFHKDLRHTGQSSVNGPATSRVKWTWMSPGVDIIRGSPTIGADGTVYVATGYWFCAIRPDGLQRWCTPLSGEATFSGTAIDTDGTIYYGARDNRLYAFRPDGSIKWRHLIRNDGDVHLHHQWRAARLDSGGLTRLGREWNQAQGVEPQLLAGHRRRRDALHRVLRSQPVRIRPLTPELRSQGVEME